MHDLHVWQISSGFPSLSAHVLVHQGDDCHAIRRELEQLLDERFHIEHTTLQVDHAPKGVRVNCVSPGPVLTPLMRRNRTPDEIAMIGQGSLLGRVANPEELADAIVYLASDQASYVVGQTLPVNGGAAARI